MKQFAFLLMAWGAVWTCSAQSDSSKLPHTYAQKLVDAAMAKHPNVVILAMHAKSPADSNYPIIAWGGPMGGKVRIGKKADEDDMRVITTGKENLEVNATGNHFEVELPLQDASKKTIGALGVVFNYKSGDNKAEYKKAAEQLRDELRDQIPSADKLAEAP